MGIPEVVDQEEEEEQEQEQEQEANKHQIYQQQSCFLWLPYRPKMYSS